MEQHVLSKGSLVPSSLSAKIAVFVHVVLVLAAVHYVTRIANFTPLSELPNKDTLVFAATGVPPLLAGWIGARLARNERAARLLSFGLWLGAAIYAVSFASVVFASDNEPLAPLWLILVSVWLAVGYGALLLAVWLVGRRA
jgi:hypothetical protein